MVGTGSVSVLSCTLILSFQVAYPGGGSHRSTRNRLRSMRIRVGPNQLQNLSQVVASLVYRASFHAMLTSRVVVLSGVRRARLESA